MITRPSLGNPALVHPRLAQLRGHTHFWKRAFSRRTFLQAAGVTAGLLGAGARTKSQASVPANTPKPIPGGFMFPGFGDEVFHNFAPGVFDSPDSDPSGIFDFKGDVGYAIIDGSGTGVQKGKSSPLNFECDVRFMQGDYVATDGRTRSRTFALF